MVVEIKMFFDKPISQHLEITSFYYRNIFNSNRLEVFDREIAPKNFTKLARNTCDRNFEGQSPEDVL